MTSIQVARHEWEEGTRRLEDARGDARRYERLLAYLDLVLDGLRKRIGQTFTLAELVAGYDEAESWAREVLDSRAPARDWPRELTTVVAAAFDTYQRGASDYEP